MYWQNLVFLITSFKVLTANDHDFVVVSTTVPPPSNQRRIRQEHDPYFDKRDETCAALTKSTYLLEIIKLQNAQTLTNLEKLTHLQADNASYLQLQQTNAFFMERVQGGLQEAKEQIVGNIVTLLTNQLGNLCNLNQLRYTQVVIVSEIQRLLRQGLEAHEAKLEETRRAIEEQKRELQGIGGGETRCVDLVEENTKGILREIEAVRKDQAVFYQKMEDLQRQNDEVRESLKKLRSLPRNCKEIQGRGSDVSGVYYIQPDSAPEAFKVFCDMKTKEGGWVYLMNRFDGSLGFFQNWTDYRNGFGRVDGEFWLGLEHLYELTGENPNELLIELVDWDNKKVHAHYTSFSIGSEEESYPLKVLSGYSGNAKDSLTYHLKMNFSTADHDQSKGGYCASFFKAAWWYKDCFTAHLTGPYLEGPAATNAMLRGIHWNGFRYLNYSYSLKQARMMVRPAKDDNALLPHERENV